MFFLLFYFFRGQLLFCVMMLFPCSCFIFLLSEEIEKIDKVQSTFWREWKLKLEEEKRVADHSRALEKIIPGVETERFLSGDIKYIEGVIVSLIESAKLVKKSILIGVLKIADTYGLNRTEVCGCACISLKNSNIEDK
jgi:hypothetical protein